MFVTPQTGDGWVTRVEPGEGRALVVEVEFAPSPDFASLIAGRQSEVAFASRSRLARLGIDVRPAEWALEGDTVRMTATVQSILAAYGVEPYLPRLILPGLAVGRLVFCPEERRLSSERLYEETVAHSLQLPASFSIDQEGRFSIHSHRLVYDLIGAPTLDDLRIIVSRREGQDLLNRIQVGRPVPHIVLQPGDGVITSCSMFLHRHYVVLDREASRLGQHLQAVVLDPVSTRGTRVFLEFCNHAGTPVVNPAVAGTIYEAMPVSESRRRWHAVGAAREAATPARAEDYDSLVTAFDRIEGAAPGTSYFDRTVAVVDDTHDLLAGGQPRAIWRRPAGIPETDVSYHAYREAESRVPPSERFGTSVLRDLEPGAGTTLFLRYFPNLFEHLDICAAVLAGKVSRLVFRNASYEHGMFLSARDHGRLADYDALGIEVYWCNDTRRHVVTHVYRGLRGYFMEAPVVEQFRSRLMLALYGSTLTLPDPDRVRLKQLVINLKAFFGDSIAILTGGGPGAMQQAADIAQEVGILAGANFIETIDQETHQSADFYQTFQSRSRHSRQRWFEVASFHLFVMGGIGTLEEVGLTLTDMKLGIIELSPLVFFGAHGDDPYWAPLREQLMVMIAHRRAPDWLKSHILMTNDPDEIPQFYRRTLGLG